MRRQPHPIGCFTDKQRVPNPRPQPREQLFGQDDPGRIADLGDFEWCDRTGVITEALPIGNPTA